MTRRRLLPPPPPPAFDVDATLEDLRDQLGRIDAVLAAADELIPQPWSGAGGLMHRRNHVSHYMAIAREAVREAMRAGDQLDLHRQQLRADR